MLEKFKEFCALVETSTRKIKNLCNDRGGGVSFQ
jgi:hypothetical protein